MTQKKLYIVLINGELEDKCPYDYEEDAIYSAKDVVFASLYDHGIEGLTDEQLEARADVSVHVLDSESKIQLPISSWKEEWYSENSLVKKEMEKNEYKEYLRLHAKWEGKRLSDALYSALTPCTVDGD